MERGGGRPDVDDRATACERARRRSRSCAARDLARREVDATLAPATRNTAGWQCLGGAGGAGDAAVLGTDRRTAGASGF